jgi:hypothetical protein
MTSPSAERLLLIACASFMVAPAAPLFLTRSDPARSTNDSLPRVTPCVCRSVVSMTSEKIKCERLDCAFIFVADVARECKPVAITASMSSFVRTGTTVAFCTVTHPLLSFLMSSLGAGPLTRIPTAARALRRRRRRR